MKTLACALITLAGCALSSAVFAAEDDGWITGTVVRVNGTDDFEINEAKRGGESNFELVCAGDFHSPKVGEKVRVHYYHCGSGRKGFHHCADKIEKIGKAENPGTKK